jgi:hypothetical protein
MTSMTFKEGVGERARESEREGHYKWLRIVLGDQVATTLLFVDGLYKKDERKMEI